MVGSNFYMPKSRQHTVILKTIYVRLGRRNRCKITWEESTPGSLSSGSKGLRTWHAPPSTAPRSSHAPLSSPPQSDSIRARNRGGPVMTIHDRRPKGERHTPQLLLIRTTTPPPPTFGLTIILSSVSRPSRILSPNATVPTTLSTFS